MMCFWAEHPHAQISGGRTVYLRLAKSVAEAGQNAGHRGTQEGLAQGPRMWPKGVRKRVVSASIDGSKYTDGYGEGQGGSVDEGKSVDEWRKTGAEKKQRREADLL